MATKWFCSIENQQYGPFPWAQLQQFVSQSRLTPADLVRREDDRQWYQAGQFPELFPQTPSPAPAPAARTQSPPKPPAAAKPKVATAAGPAANAAPAPARKPPVAKAPADTSSAAIPARVASATSETLPTGVAVVPVSPPGGKAADAWPGDPHDHSGGGKTSQQPLIIVAGLGGVLAVLAIMAVIVTSGGDQPASAPADVAAETAGGEANPETAEANPAEAEVAPPANDPSRELLAVTRTVRSWRDASRQRAGLKDIARIHVDAVWRQYDPSGAMQLGVELHVKNMAPDSTLNFSGWATPSADPQQQVVLLAGEDNVLPVVDRSPEASSTVRLAPGEVLETRLTFAVPTDAELNGLRIAIPYAAIGLTDHIGYEIPNVMITNAPPEATVAPAAVQGVAAGPPPASATPSTGEPTTISDLTKSIQRSTDRSTGQPTGPNPGATVSTTTTGEPDMIGDLKAAIGTSKQDAN